MATKKAIRTAYLENLVSHGYLNSAREVAASPNTPICKGLALCLENVVSPETINRTLAEIGLDLACLHAGMKETATGFGELLVQSKQRLDAVRSALRREEELLMDINLITGQDGLKRIIPLESFTGSFSLVGGAAYVPTATGENVPLTVVNVTGNGYEGNAYVWDGNAFLADSLDTKNRNNLVDDSAITTYEYSRLLGSGVGIPAFVRSDGEGAACTIEVSAATEFNSIWLDSDNPLLWLKRVDIAGDGGLWRTVWDTPRQLIDRSQRYIRGDYPYGSGRIPFPPARQVRLYFSSTEATDDKIAWKAIDGGDGIVHPLETVHRSAIQIKQLKAELVSYGTSCQITSPDIAASGATRVCIWALESMPESGSGSVRYHLYVNGIAYEIVPSNSLRDGKKILCFGNADSSKIELPEPAETVRLQIDITATETETPLVGSIKLCLGGSEHVQ